MPFDHVLEDEEDEHLQGSFAPAPSPHFRGADAHIRRLYGRNL